MEKKITTSELLSQFNFENGSPSMADETIIDNGDTITIIIEGFEPKDFPKPDDFEEYLKSLEG